MKWMWRALALIGLAIAALLVILWTSDTNPAAMKAKYGKGSSFAPVTPEYAIHYRDQGCAACPALVLIHGTSSSLHTWEPLVAHLYDQFRIVTLDLPGHGLTGPHPTRDYTQQGADEAINAVITAAGVDKFALGGNSLGGLVAWRYALDHEVEALILLDPAGAPQAVGEVAPKSNIGFRIMKTPAVANLTTVITPRGLVKASLSQSVSNQDVVTPTAVDRYWELLRYPGNRRAMIDRVRADHGPSEFTRLTTLQTPTLVIWGDKDTIIPPERAALFIDALPNATLKMYEGIGHLPMEEAADRTARDIAAFLLRD